MIAVRFVFRYVPKNEFLGHDAAKRVYRLFQVFQSLRLGAVCVRLSDGRDAMVLDLAYTFARYAVFLPDSIKCSAITLGRQPVPVCKYLSGALRKTCKQDFGHRFGCT